MKILGIIPARKGSKGIPNKCLRPLCGKPLLQWTLDAAGQCKSLSATVLTTDYEPQELVDAGICDEHALIIRRPPRLCSDVSRGAEVAWHAFMQAENERGESFDAMIYLQPTCPLREASEIDKCAAELECGRGSVATMVPVGGDHPMRMVDYFGTSVLKEDEFGGNRQYLPDIFIRSGSVYGCTPFLLPKTMISSNSHKWIKCDRESWVNIDDERDWILAEALMQRRLAGDWKQRPGNDQTARVNENGNLENADGRLLPLEGVDAG